MGNKVLSCGILVSKNAKTGESINFGLSTCSPTRWCKAHCYARARTARIAHRLGSTSNCGPVTWHKQHAAWERNKRLILKLSDDELWAAGHELAKRMHGRPLRWNGVGDLFRGVEPFISAAAFYGTLLYGFSRNPEVLLSLADYLDKHHVIQPRPHFLGSVDVTTTDAAIKQLVKATSRVNGQVGPSLAIGISDGLISGRGFPQSDAWLAKARSRAWFKYVKVIFGYHAGRTKTKLGLGSIECPATSGVDITCRECGRCMNPQKGIDIADASHVSW